MRRLILFNIRHCPKDYLKFIAHSSTVFGNADYQEGYGGNQDFNYYSGEGGSSPTFQFPKGQEEYYQKNYPAFYDFVKNLLPNMVADEKFKKALSTASGFSMEELAKSFKYGKGMVLKEMVLILGDAEY